MKQTRLLLLGLLSFMVIACGDGEEDPMTTECETEGITYSDGASQILNASCATAGCHTDDDLAGGFSLDDYDNAFAAVGFNRIVGSINHTTGFLPMPYPAGTAKLDQCDIDKMTAWINDGAPE